MRTGDDQHGNDAFHREHDRCAGDKPPDESHPRRDDRHDRENESRAVGKILRPRPRALRLSDQPHYAGECGVFSGAGHLDAERACAVNRSGNDLVSRFLVDRTRFASDHGLIDCAAPVANDAIGWNARAGPNEHDVSISELRHGYVCRFLAINARCHVRNELGQLVERALRLHDRPHLDPVAEEHDGDERRELPPEIHPRDAKCYGEAEDKRHRNGERDQRHHSR